MSVERISHDRKYTGGYDGARRARYIAVRSFVNPSRVEGESRKHDVGIQEEAGGGNRQTINPTAWQTAALGFEGPAALKHRQQRPMTGPENGAGTGRRARLAWPGLAEELLESPPCRGRPRGRLRMCAPRGLRRSRSSKCSFGSCP